MSAVHSNIGKYPQWCIIRLEAKGRVVNPAHRPQTADVVDAVWRNLSQSASCEAVKQDCRNAQISDVAGPPAQIDLVRALVEVVTVAPVRICIEEGVSARDYDHRLALAL